MDHSHFHVFSTSLFKTHNVQSVERVEILRGELRKEHAEKEDQLRERLTEKDVHINSHLKDISDLQQQLKVTLFII